jgi:aminoglycoside phosphotransferase (APT) family kinase protein
MNPQPPGRMHQAETVIDPALVTSLVAEQFPELSQLPVRPVASTGTVNAIFRLGDQLCVRLPRVEAWTRNLSVEWWWLPILAPHLSLRVPEPVKRGSPLLSLLVVDLPMDRRSDLCR